MLTTTTAMGLRVMSISATPCTSTTSRTMLLRSSSHYGTLCPLGLRTATSLTASSSGSGGGTKILVGKTSASSSRTAVSSSSYSSPVPSTIRTDSSLAGASSTSTATTTSPSSPPQNQPLDWTTFFALRKTRRRYQVTFSALGSLGSSFVGAYFLASPMGDSLLSQIPLDPFIGFGLGMTVFLALGWLFGPSVGNACFYLVNSKWRRHMTSKEAEFFARIRKNRVDPTVGASTGNPVPDFYGEKIQSISGYRQWLKDQRAFNKKRTTFV